MPRTRRAQLLLDAVLEGLNAGRIEERIIEAKGDNEHVYGWCGKDGLVVINPMPDIVTSLIHELLHRQYPAWEEPYVKARTTELLKALSHFEALTLYRHYQALVRRDPMPLEVD